MYAGGLLGLVGTTPNLNLFVPALTGATSFLIVILVIINGTGSKII